MQAVILYHLHDYGQALSVLNSLYQNIEPIDEVLIVDYHFPTSSPNFGRYFLKGFVKFSADNCASCVPSLIGYCIDVPRCNEGSSKLVILVLMFSSPASLDGELIIHKSSPEFTFNWYLCIRLSCHYYYSSHHNN